MANSKTSGAPNGGNSTSVQGKYNVPRKAGIPRGAGGQSYPPGVGPGKQMADSPKVMKAAGTTATPYNTPRKGGIPGSPRGPKS